MNPTPENLTTTERQAERLLALIYGNTYAEILQLDDPFAGEIRLSNGTHLERLALFDHDYLGWHYLAIECGRGRVVLLFVDWLDRDVYLIDSWPWPGMSTPWVEAAAHVTRWGPRPG